MTKASMSTQRFIIEVHDGIEPSMAMTLCAQVCHEGLVSGPQHRRQHCYVSGFHINGILHTVACVKRGKSERFIVSREIEHPAPTPVQSV